MTFTRYDILAAMLTKDIPIEHSSFGEIVAQTLTGTPALWDICTNLTNYEFNIGPQIRNIKEGANSGISIFKI